MPAGWAMAAATVYAGSQSAGAASDAAEAQAAASRYAADIQKAMFDVQNEQQKPYREAGYSALSDIAGLKPYLQERFGPEEFAKGMDPSYQFRLQQGEEATRRAANVGGGQISGNTLKALNDYSQNSASTEYANAFNRFQTERGNIYNTLASIAGLGQTSLGQTGMQSATAAGNIGNAMANAGSAAAAGTVGRANAIGGTVQSLANQYYMNSLRNNYGGGGGGGASNNQFESDINTSGFNAA